MAEERMLELEALEAIFGDELKFGEGDESAEQVAEGHARFQIRLDNADLGVQARLAFRYTQEYPEAAPEISVLVDQGMSSALGASVQKLLLEEAQGQLGLPMIYTLHSLAKEWIADHGSGGADAGGNDRRATQDVTFETRDLQTEHAVEAKKFHGTPVTPESFTEWKVKFDAEVGTHKAENGAEDHTDRLTGRALFEANKAVITEESLSLWEDEADAYGDDDDGGDGGANVTTNFS